MFIFCVSGFDAEAICTGGVGNVVPQGGSLPAVDFDEDTVSTSQVLEADGTGGELGERQVEGLQFVFDDSLGEAGGHCVFVHLLSL